MDGIKKDLEKVQEAHNFAEDMYNQMKDTILWQRKAIKSILIVGILSIAIAIGTFIWYINQFEVVSSVEATGIYNNMENGIITSQDVSPEVWSQFLEWLATTNGEN